MFAGGDPWRVNQSLQSGRPAEISNLAQAFHDAGESTADADDAFQRARERFEQSWNRETGEHPINDSLEVRRATASLGVQAAQLPKIAVDLEAVAASLAEAQRFAGTQIASLENELQQIDDELGEALELERNGHLSELEKSILDQHITELEQQAIDDTAATLRQVEHIRDGYAAELQKAQANLRTDGYDPALVQGLDAPLSPPKPEQPAIPIPPPDTGAEDVKKWWDSLSQQQKEQLITQHPPELGNLNGIDADVRDTVNQAVMNDDLNRVLDAAKGHGVSPEEVVRNPAIYGLSATDITRYQNAVRTRDGLKYDRGPDPGNPRPVMLWAYDPLAFNGQGKVVIAIGNPDWARNTAVIVPGTGSSVAQGWLVGHDDAINLYDQSLAADPDHRYTSVMAWMGYDAPDGFTDIRVSQPWLAREGGDLLAGDVNALAVTHNGLTPEHITVIGHSYGATTVADAFAHGGMRANDAVLLGCPGADLARSAADFHLGGGHVYVGSASSDPISWIGNSDGVPREMLKDYLREHHIPLPVAAGLGIDPAGSGFGSIRFHAEVPGHGSVNEHDHSHYYVRGSEALRSITDIASGHPDRLATDGMLAEGRRQPHVGPLRIPGLPAFIDPEADRPPDTINDDHAYRTDESPR